MQLYTGNFLDGSHTGRDGEPLGRHCGVCLETQAWPNAINIQVRANSQDFTHVYTKFWEAHVGSVQCFDMVTAKFLYTLSRPFEANFLFRTCSGGKLMTFKDHNEFYIRTILLCNFPLTHLVLVYILLLQGARGQVILRPGEQYTAKTVWKLSWKK